MFLEISTNMSSRCSVFFLSTLVSCQVLAHSYWDDKGLYRLPKTETLFSSCGIWLFFFLQTVSRKTHLLRHSQGSMCVAEGSMCVYVYLFM